MPDLLRHVIIPTLLTLFALQSSARCNDHSPIVIIHGAWGGAHHWKAVADSLTHDHGQMVRRAALTGLGERSHLASKKINLETHIRDVVEMIEFDDLHSVILIAHSYGGAVAAGVIDAVPERISRVIYLDSHVLDDGESYLTHHAKRRAELTKRAEEAGDGWLIPVDWPNAFRDVPHPLATLTQPIKLTNPAREKIQSAYWLFADGKEPEKDSRYFHYQRAVDRGWKTRVFPWNHNPHRDRPTDVTTELIAAMGASSVTE